MKNHRYCSATLSRTLLITGTDTDAGKTVLTTALAAYWQKVFSQVLGQSSLGIIKPIQSGIGDRELIARLFDLDKLDQSLEELNPIYFSAPLAPPLAAEQENASINLSAAWQAFSALRERKSFVLVEALGGLGSPITRELTVADLARDWRLPTVLVVPVKLGAIGQAIANVALARQAAVNLKGIILNCVQPCSDQEIAQWAPQDLIESLTNVPVCGIIPHFDYREDIEQLVTVAANLDLEYLL
jgi:dethiobiotin synthetase